MFEFLKSLWRKPKIEYEMSWEERMSRLSSCPEVWEDNCLICGKPIPPGPDFCSPECENKTKKEVK